MIQVTKIYMFTEIIDGKKIEMEAFQSSALLDFYVKFLESV